MNLSLEYQSRIVPGVPKIRCSLISDLGAQIIALHSISYLEFRVKFFLPLNHFSYLKDQLISLGEAQTVGYPTAQLTQRQLFYLLQTKTGQLSSAGLQQISKAACSLAFWMDRWSSWYRLLTRLTECREEFGSCCRFSTWFVLSVELLLIGLLSKEDNSVLFLSFICLLCISVALVPCLFTARRQHGPGREWDAGAVNSPADTAWLPYGDNKNCFPTEMGEYYHTTTIRMGDEEVSHQT